MNIKILIKLSEKYCKDLNFDKTKLFVNYSNNCTILEIYGKLYYQQYNIFSFNKLNHPNCDMEIIQNFHFFNNDEYTRRAIISNVKNFNFNENRDKLNIIYKDIIKTVCNKNCIFHFSSQNDRSIPFLTELGFKPIVNYKNHNHGSLDNRSIYLLDLKDFNYEKEMEKLNPSKEPIVKVKRKYTRRKKTEEILEEILDN